MLSNSVICVIKIKMLGIAGTKWISESQLKTHQKQNKLCDAVAEERTQQQTKWKAQRSVLFGLFSSDLSYRLRGIFELDYHP